MRKLLPVHGGGGAATPGPLPAPRAPAAPDEEVLGRFGARAPLARTLLVALAWGRGPGLPHDGIWPQAAAALAAIGGPAPPHGSPGRAGDATRPVAIPPPRVADRDVRWLLRRAKGLVTQQPGPGGRTMYRLCDEALAVRLRRPPPAAEADGLPGGNRTGGREITEWRQRAERAMTGALLATVPTGPVGREWSAAHTYVRAHLAGHAAAAGPDVLASLVDDPGFLAVADPAILGPLLYFPPDALVAVERLYQRARPLLGTDPHMNAAYLDEAARTLDLGAVPTPAPRPRYRTHLTLVRRDDSVMTLTGHTNWVNEVAFGTTPDGRLLLASGGDDGTVRVWAPWTGRPVGSPLVGHRGFVTMVAFGAVAGDGEAGAGSLLLASSGQDGTVRLWDPLTGEGLGEPLPASTSWAMSVAFGTSADGQQVLLGCGAGKENVIRVWDPLTRRLRYAPLAGHAGGVRRVAFGAGPDGSPILASASGDETVRLWDPLAGTPLGEPLTGHRGGVWAVKFARAHDGRLLLASGGEDSTVRLWDPLTGMAVGDPLTGHSGHVSGLGFGAVGGRLLLASAGNDGVRVWDPLAGGLLADLKGHTGHVAGIAFGAAQDGTVMLATASADTTVRVWNLRTVLAGPPAPDHLAPVSAVAMTATPAGSRLLATAGGRDADIHVHAVPGGQPVCGVPASHADLVCALSFGAAAGGRLLLASASRDRTVRVWDAHTGAPVGVPLLLHTGVNAVAFGTLDGDGEAGQDHLVLASAGDDAMVWLWDPADGTARGKLDAHTGSVTALAFGAVTGEPGGGRLLLASAGQDQVVQVWDLVTGTAACPPLAGHVGVVNAVAFGQVMWEAGGEGKRAGGAGRLLLASAGADRTVRLWDPCAGAPVGVPLAGHADWVSSVAFAEMAGRPLLVSGSADMTVRGWDLATRACVLTLRRRSRVRALAAAGPLLTIGDDEGMSVVELTGEARDGS